MTNFINKIQQSLHSNTGIVDHLRKIRAPVVRFMKPKRNYFMLPVKQRNLKPISNKFGFNRGNPIDRYWIESFLKEHQTHIRGKCLEITDNKYTKKFGLHVQASDVLDVSKNNKLANIHGDLRNLKGIIPNNTYDCIILTHVLGMIDDYEAAVKEINRILKPGGVLLFTSSSISPTYKVESNFWRFTPASTKYVFSKYFGEDNLEIKSYGNAFAGQAFWLGFAQEELSKRQLEYNDPHFPCIVAAKVVKKGGSGTKIKTSKNIHAVVKYFYPVTAGIEVNMLETYSYLAKWEAQVTIHTSKDEYLTKNSLPNTASVRGLGVKRYPFQALGFWPQINWQEAELVCLHNFDIFPHFQIMVYSLLLKLFGKKKFTLVLTPHGGFSLDSVWNLFPFWQRVVKRTYHQTLGKWLINQAVDGIRAVSVWEKQEMINAGIDPKKIEVIANGVEDEAYMNIDKLASKDIKAKVQRWGKYLIRIGRIYPIKNDETIIKALPKLPKNIKLVIVGPIEANKYPQYIDGLKKLVQELKLEKRVIFAGVVRGIDKYYLIKKSQMMVHMAMWESFCNVVHEGLSQGKICIVADNTALPFLIKDGVNGYCIPTKDHQTLAKKINYVLKNINSKHLRKMSARNRKFGLQESWKKVAQKMDAWYGSLLIDKNI